MTPLQLMNNDMATLMLSSKKIFEYWNDTVSDSMNKNLIMPMQRNWNAYIDEMNVRMKILMSAEAEIENAVKKIKMTI